MIKPVVRFLKSGPADKKLLLEATFSLARARWWMKTRSFGRIRVLLNRGTDYPITEVDPGLVGKIGKAIERSSRHLPWKCACMTQAIAGKFMLTKRHYPGQILMGVDKPEPDKFDAHAWLMCGDLFVTGESDHARYTVVMDFANPNPSPAHQSIS